MMNSDFFAVLQVALGNRSVEDLRLGENAFDSVCADAKKHSLLGLCYPVFKQLKESGATIDSTLFLKSYAVAGKLKQRNIELDEDCRLISENFRKAGFDTCILKGQGLALLYELVRISGDVDVWVMPKEKGLSLAQRRKKIHAYCESLVGKTDAVYHHMDFPVLQSKVEVHFTPSWMFSPFTNRKLQKFFEKEWEHRVPTDKGFYVPSAVCNAVFVLVHIYRHLFDEGIGLRQILDYYMVLTRQADEHVRTQAMSVLTDLGMKRFTAAIMYVLQVVFAIESKYLLCVPDAVAGTLVLEEILEAGNFGRGDNRYAKKDNNIQTASGWNNLKIQVVRNAKFLRFFPDEVLWNVPFRVWHYCWRKKNGWR